MRKVFPFLLLASLLLVGCQAQPALTLGEESFLGDFTVEGDQVSFPCALAVRNLTDGPVSFTVCAIDEEDAQGGLLAGAALQALDADGNVAVFTVQAGHEPQIVEVTLVGRHGTGEQKYDRELPGTIFLTPMGEGE